MAAGMGDVADLLNMMAPPGSGLTQQAPSTPQTNSEPAPAQSSPSEPAVEVAEPGKSTTDEDGAPSVDAEPIEDAAEAAASPTTTNSSPEAAPEAATNRSKRRAKKAAPSHKPVQPAAKGPRSVYIASDVERLLSIASAATHRSYTDITLVAVSNHYTNARDLPAFAATRQETSGGLFPRPVAQPKPTRSLSSLYLSEAETETLDRVASEADLSRSELVTRCLRAHLSRQVFSRMEIVLELQDSGKPTQLVAQRVAQMVSSGVPARRLPDEREGWVTMPAQWTTPLASSLDAAQAELGLGSWTEVLWAAFAE